jgi:hypothetical protein
MNTKLSQNIYSELIIGKYINQQEINEKNIKIDSELFIEIKSNFTDYENMYNNLGYSLLSGDSFNYYYLKKQAEGLEEDELELDKNLIKEYVLSLCLCRQLLEEKKGLEPLLNVELGVSKAYLDSFLKNQKYEDLFKAADISLEKSDPIFQILEKKNILIKNNSGNFIASNIFEDFIKYQEKIGKVIEE